MKSSGPGIVFSIVLVGMLIYFAIVDLRKEINLHHRCMNMSHGTARLEECD